MMELDLHNENLRCITRGRIHKERYLLFVVLILLCSAWCKGQNKLQYSGRIFDENKLPIPYCTISVLSDKDSSLVLGCVSDEAGCFAIDSLSFGQYI